MYEDREDSPDTLTYAILVCVSPDEMLELRAVLQKSKLRNFAPPPLKPNLKTPFPFTFKIMLHLL